jgi:prevent-host-death family protein
LDFDADGIPRGGRLVRDEFVLTLADESGLARPSPHGYHSHVEKATISELKNRLSAYIKKVRAGQSVLILDRDQPVARLERVEATPHADDRLARLERAGLLRRARSSLPLDALRSPAPQPGASVVQALLDERREGR